MIGPGPNSNMTTNEILSRSKAVCFLLKITISTSNTEHNVKVNISNLRLPKYLSKGIARHAEIQFTAMIIAVDYAGVGRSGPPSGGD